MSNAVPLAAAPHLPGLYFRYYAGEADFAAMVAVVEKCQLTDHIDPLSSEAGVPTAEELRTSFTEAANMELQQDLLLACYEDQVIGFQWMRWWEEADKTRIFYHRSRLIPEWRGTGIIRAMLLWAENRGKQIIRTSHFTGQACFQVNTTEHELIYNDLLLSESYIEAHTFVEMQLDRDRPLPGRRLPPGFRLKPAQSQHYRAIWEANEAAFSDEWGHRQPTEMDFLLFMTDAMGSQRSNPSLWQIAWHHNQVAGIAFAEITPRNIGLISELSVIPQWRGQGLGRALLAHALHALAARDVQQIRVFTDNDRAQTLYQSMGFNTLTSYTRYRKPVSLI